MWILANVEATHLIDEFFEVRLEFENVLERPMHLLVDVRDETSRSAFSFNIVKCMEHLMHFREVPVFMWRLLCFSTGLDVFLVLLEGSAR